VDLGREFRVGGDLRERDDDNLVVGGRLADLLEDAVDEDVLAGEGEAVLGAVGVAPAVAHAEGVVDDDDVDVLALHAEEGAEQVALEAEEAGDEQGGEGDEEAAQQQQDELFDDEAAAAAFLGLEEELHRGPAQALEAHAVNQVDDDRGADEG